VETISRILDICKRHFRGDVGLVLILVLASSASFGLGRLSAVSGDRDAIRIDYPEAVTRTLSEASQLAGIGSSGVVQEESLAFPQGEGLVVSKNGSAYHLPWCSGAKRIKEENKVWFATSEEAISAGYRPAANCPGL
jgi:hypothetical protein